METLKNFFTGLVVIVLALVICAIVSLTWPLIVGLSSLLLTIVMAVLFVVLIFYIIVLAGYLTRQIIKKR